VGRGRPRKYATPEEYYQSKLEWGRRHYHQDIEAARAYRRNWFKANPEKRALYQRRWRAKKRGKKDVYVD